MTIVRVVVRVKRVKGDVVARVVERVGLVEAREKGVMLPEVNA